MFVVVVFPWESDGIPLTPISVHISTGLSSCSSVGGWLVVDDGCLSYTVCCQK